MDNSIFPTQVKQHFDFLLAKYGFSIESETNTDFPLAEWIIKLCSKELCIQVSIDKAQVFIDVGLPSKDMTWFDLMYVMMYLSQESKWRYLQLSGEINEAYYDKQLAYLSKILQENYEQIKRVVNNIMNNKNEKRSFEKFVRKYSK